jgi:transposase-like protein
MGQVRHGSATTTFAVRAAIQRPQASLARLSRELGINPKTVAKWRKRETVEDLKTGPKAPRSRRCGQLRTEAPARPKANRPNQWSPRSAGSFRTRRLRHTVKRRKASTPRHPAMTMTTSAPASERPCPWTTPLHACGATVPVTDARHRLGRRQPTHRRIVVRCGQATGPRRGAPTTGTARPRSHIRAASRWLIPSAQASRTFRYMSTVMILPPAHTPEWPNFAPPYGRTLRRR